MAQPGAITTNYDDDNNKVGRKGDVPINIILFLI